MLPMSFRFSWLPECFKPGILFFQIVPAGELGTLWLTQFNEARSQSGISGLISQTYLHTSFYFPTWQRAKPRTLVTNLFGFDDFLHVFYTVVAIWTHVCWTSHSVRTEIQTGSVRFVRFIYIFFEAGISSLRGTWPSAAWVLSISWWISSSTELSTG